MKFQLREDGQARKRRFYALLPVRIGTEIRWLEWVEVYEVFRRTRWCTRWRKTKYRN